MPQVKLYSDGSFFFGQPPTYGWLAVGDGGRVLSSGRGECANDGSNNVAAEIAGALAALAWAVSQGFDRIVLHADLSSLGGHFARGRQQDGTTHDRRPKKRRFMSEMAAAWMASHRHVDVQFVFTRDKQDVKLREAHHLSRAALAMAA